MFHASCIAHCACLAYATMLFTIAGRYLPQQELYSLDICLVRKDRGQSLSEPVRLVLRYQLHPVTRGG